MSLLQVKNIVKQHGTETVVNNVSFNLEAGERIAIAGETGSGKTTLLRIIAGLGQADSGEVLFEGSKVRGVNEKLMPGHSGIAYLSQHFELNNNYRVEEVIEYANKLTPNETKQLIEVCKIAHLQKRLTQTLSGGEKQRVALARLLTYKPRLLLLDEPYSNMDQIHTHVLKNVVDAVGEQLGITCMLISHDPEDILPWADEVMIMQQGRVIQSGSPEMVYRHPKNEYAAGLLGKFNVLTLTLAMTLPDRQISAFIRPEDMQIVDGPGEKTIQGRVYRSSYYGSHHELTVLVDGQRMYVYTLREDISEGDMIFLTIRGNAVTGLSS